MAYGSSDSFRSAGTGRSSSSRKSYRSAASSYDPSMDVPSSGGSVSDSSRRSRGGGGGGSVHSTRSARSQSSRASARSQSGRSRQGGGDGPGTPRPAAPRAGSSTSFSYSPRRAPPSPGGGSLGGGGGGGSVSGSVRSSRSAPASLSRPNASGGAPRRGSALGSLDEDRADVPGEYYGGDYDAPLDVGSVRSGASASSRQSGRGSVHSARQTSVRSTGSAASDMIDLRSVRSNRTGVSRQGSVRSAASRESHSTPQVSNRVRSDASLSSRRSGSSSRHSAGRVTFDEAVRHLDKGRHGRAVRDLTSLISRARPDDPEDLARLHCLRAEGLLALGACGAASADARRALDHERAGGSGRNPNEGSDGERSSGGGRPGALGAESGGVLRARATCALARSLLAMGVSHGLESMLDAASDLSRRLLEEAADASDGSRRHERAVAALARARDGAEEGSRQLARYKELVTKYDTSSFGKREAMRVLDEAIEIAPDNVEWHVRKLDHLVRKRRWFSVANHCERHAASRSRLDGIFVGDLRSADPFVPGMPALRELDDRFFHDAGRPSGAAPVHLRALGPSGARDAAFRLPPEMLPVYLRSLRLEMRFDAAELALSAVEEYDAGVDGTARVCDPSDLRRERAKLDETVRLRERGDAQRGEGFHDQAIKLYGECLAVDAGGAAGTGTGTTPGILKRQSSWPAASGASNAGGKLHAVLHDTRASCLVSLDKLDSAAAESGRALDVHSMYVGALLRRARVHAALGDVAGAKADFTRFIVLVEGAGLHPYPPPNQGAACHFDMPSEVTDGQLAEVQAEMEELGIKAPAGGRKAGKKKRGSLNPFSFLCNKKKTASQVADGRDPAAAGDAAAAAPAAGGKPARWPMGRRNFKGGKRTAGAGRRSSPAAAKPPQSPGRSSRARSRSRPRVSFSLSPARRKKRGGADGPDPDPDGDPADGSDDDGADDDEDPLLDPPEGVVADPGVDYYAVLGVDDASAPGAEIREAYRRLAEELGPGGSDGGDGAAGRFEGIRVAYAVLADEEKRREYDEARGVDP